MVNTLPAIAPHMPGLIHCGIESSCSLRTRGPRVRRAPSVMRHRHSGCRGFEIAIPTPHMTAYRYGIAKAIGLSSNRRMLSAPVALLAPKTTSMKTRQRPRDGRVFDPGHRALSAKLLDCVQRLHDTPSRVVASNEAEMSKRLFDGLTLFGRHRDNATAASRAIGGTPRR